MIHFNQQNELNKHYYLLKQNSVKLYVLIITVQRCDYFFYLPMT